MNNFSQTFVTYHGCGKCYLDGTNELLGNRSCLMRANNPFWKKPEDTCNKKVK